MNTRATTPAGPVDGVERLHGTARPDRPSRAHRAAGTGELTFLGVVHSEWTKLRSLRSTVWTLASAVVLIVGLSVMFCATEAHETDAEPAFDSTFFSLAGLFLAQVAVGVLGVLTITGEYASGMIRATLGLVPRRLPMLWAKVMVFAAVTFTLMLATSFVAFLVGQRLLAGKDLDVTLGDPGSLRAVVGCAFYLTIVGLLGLAGGALLRHTAGAVSALLGVVLALPMIVGMLPASLQRIDAYLPTTLGETLVTIQPREELLSVGSAVAVLTGYVVVLLAAAAVTLTRRDV
ncbi:ABC transporter permease [Frankia sp. CNm7]|uniref:ABC transporter permease n=1 Tax=Frankia nepalensis TaxID=1836974 RepID=A0A937RSH4_9ACTN|nr:ABC transporter permease [Frankia nepalensis]MBL7496224.1 ABC transporter permease [Frankia nepalensis]MBL7511637.1 ABC transporter permease [Frankia nepalensis]MBL7517738.1 ABC transporter permease [Frankia nepalensis]MBL7631121.1 ABC transporter permease [Frankia nepalensis]